MIVDVSVDGHLQLADVAAVHVIVELQTIVVPERQIRNLNPGVCTRLMARSFDVGKLAYRFVQQLAMRFLNLLKSHCEKFFSHFQRNN